MLKSKDRIASREYRVFLTEQRCCACGGKDSTPAHTISRKRADGSDLLCIPLCLKCHRAFDDAGKKKAEWLSANAVAPMGIDYAIDYFQRKFCREQGWPEGLDFEAMMREAEFVQPPHSTRKNR